MYYNQSCAAKGAQHGSRNRQLLYRSMQRAAVNIFKTPTSYEMLVFAPGRIKEHFKVDLKGKELTVTYTPPEGFQRPEWIHREYSRGGFSRSFTLDEQVDTAGITARYVDGVLELTLPLIEEVNVPAQSITIH
jgi:HSP20 family protein